MIKQLRGQNCLNGQFSEFRNSVSCEPCPRGFYGLELKISCQECLRGKYGDQLESKIETDPGK